MARINFTLDDETVAKLFVGDGEEAMKVLKEKALNALLCAEATEQIGADPYERTETRQTQRNGYRIRHLTTRVGTLTLRIPKLRNGTFSTELFARFARSERAFQLALIEMVLQGVSTRKVTEITEVLCGTSISKSTVSRLCAELDGPVEAFRQRPLTSSYPFLVVDAMYVKVRENGRIVSKGLLIVLGISETGHREVLGFILGDSESYETWRSLFLELRERGLRDVSFIVSDQHAGLVRAVRETFHNATWQRCQTHFQRNMLACLPRQGSGDVMALMKDMLNSPSLETATTRRDDILDYLQSHKRTKAYNLLDDAFADITAVYSLPEHYRKRLRTTNMIERQNEELRRRERVIRIFPNEESVIRLLGSLLMETHEEWISGRAYFRMDAYRHAQAAAKEKKVVPYSRPEVG